MLGALKPRARGDPERAERAIACLAGGVGRRDGLRFCGLEAFAALFAVAVQRVEDDGVCFSWWAYLIDLDGLAFELFVILKKAAEHEQAVGRHLRGLSV
jgi:hypothetical protein